MQVECIKYGYEIYLPQMIFLLGDTKVCRETAKLDNMCLDNQLVMSQDFCQSWAAVNHCFHRNEP